MRSFRIITCAFLLCSTIAAQPSERFRDSLRRIFAAGDGGRGTPVRAQWIEGGNAYSAIEPAANGAAKQIIRYDPATGRRDVLVSAAQLTARETGKPLEIQDYTWSADSKKLMVRSVNRTVLIRKPAGEYWVLDRATGKLSKLGGADGAELVFPKFSPDGSRVAYVRKADLYVEDLSSKRIRRLTTDGSDLILNGISDWVYDEEFGLGDAFRWSADGKSIALWQFDQHEVPEFSLVNYTDALYPKIFRYPYPKAGQANSAIRVGVVAAAGGKTQWIKTQRDPRNTYIPRMEWLGNGELILQSLNRLQNTNDVLLASAATGEVRRIFQDRDAAWVEVNEDMRRVQGNHLLWLSERDGWSHAYTVSLDGSLRLVTNFAGDVISIAGVDAAWLYFIASPEEATRRYLYRTRLDGSGKPERITPADSPGSHAYDLSPDGKWAFHTYSRFHQPPTTELVDLPAHKLVRTLEENKALKEMAAAILGDRTEFIRVDAGDGVTIDGWVMKPRNFDPSRKYPTVVYVYGEPAGVTAGDRWYGNRTLFHGALADEGYIIASFDNSGTPSPKGRAWRKSIYGSVGVLASKEQPIALRSLAAARPWIDLDRVAVWGWSGGGSMTDNLMFRSPDLYKVGVSVAAVPDQTLYDSIYQERYMGLPSENAKGYHDGSPIHFAEGLRGKLLIIHGSGDDNVHFQGNQRLINRLVELGKRFDFMEYPNRTHDLAERPGTLLHVYTLISRYLMEAL
jgi:dipeptidyl-peptidase-4